MMLVDFDWLRWNQNDFSVGELAVKVNHTGIVTGFSIGCGNSKEIGLFEGQDCQK